MLPSAFIQKYLNTIKYQKNILIQEDVIKVEKQKLISHYHAQEEILKNSFDQTINNLNQLTLKKSDFSNILSQISELKLSAKAADMLSNLAISISDNEFVTYQKAL